jgi:hypothetical protein
MSRNLFFGLVGRDRGLFKGGSRSGGAGGGGSAGGAGGAAGGGGAAAAQEPAASAPRAERQPTLPEGIRVDERDSEYKSYKFNAGNKQVDIYISDGLVGFTVGGQFAQNRFNRLTPDESANVAGKLLKIIKFDAASRPDGFKYVTSAVTSDGEGAKRALAYESVAKFSRPVAGRAGSKQFGIVKDGKIVPDNQALAKAEKRSKVNPANAERNYQRMLGDRDAQREQRRRDSAV